MAQVSEPQRYDITRSTRVKPFFALAMCAQARRPGGYEAFRAARTYNFSRARSPRRGRRRLLNRTHQSFSPSPLFLRQKPLRATRRKGKDLRETHYLIARRPGVGQPTAGGSALRASNGRRAGRDGSQGRGGSGRPRVSEEPGGAAGEALPRVLAKAARGRPPPGVTSASAGLGLHEYETRLSA